MLHLSACYLVPSLMGSVLVVLSGPQTINRVARKTGQPL